MHRGSKGRYQPVCGFGGFVSAARFCSADDELREYFRQRTRMHEIVPLEVQRERYPAAPPAPPAPPPAPPAHARKRCSGPD